MDAGEQNDLNKHEVSVDTLTRACIDVIHVLKKYRIVYYPMVVLSHLCK